MSATLNVKWLAWTIETPPKSLYSWSRNGRGVLRMTIKERGEQHEGGFRKIEWKPRKRNEEES